MVALLLSLAVGGLVLGGLPWLARRVRRGGAAGSSLLGPFEEMWHPAARRAQVQIEVQQEQPSPAPTPGGSGVRWRRPPPLAEPDVPRRARRRRRGGRR